MLIDLLNLKISYIFRIVNLFVAEIVASRTAFGKVNNQIENFVKIFLCTEKDGIFLPNF